MTEFYNAFISYGRADSKDFATKLYNHLTEAGFQIWFDQNDIPLAVDFQSQINHGIAKADNFIFIISPHSVNSPYCLKEINLAVQYHKRIIPLLHVEQISYETWQQRNPQGTESQWQDYQAKGLHSSFPNMPPEISKINWVDFRENADNFKTSLAGLIAIFHKHFDYVRQHTEILEKAWEWSGNKKQNRYLLVGEERLRAEQWLDIRFKHEQPPCQPSDLHCELICESLKNANNLLTQVFIGYGNQDREIMEKLSRTLMREKITIWTNKTDIKTGTDFQQEINRGVAGADNLVYLLSPDSLNSEYCQTEIKLALSYHKRIICLIVQPTAIETIPEYLRELQFINFSDWQNPEAYRQHTDELVKQLRAEEIYYQDQKLLLIKALKWQQQNRNPSILLRGYNLQHFQAWLKVAETRDQHQSISLQVEFLAASSQHQAKSLEVFISYSRTDSDLARKINDALQFQGKTTWFDQESIAAGTDFQQEIFRGIENSDNFLFIISPKSVSSPYCGDEVEYAQKLNKRFVTILSRPVEAKTLHPALAKVQWIDFTQHDGDFYANFSELVRTLDTDRDRVRSHTKWSQRSLEWQEKGKNPDFLLRGSELTIAESWLTESKQENKQPHPTDLQIEFIAKSQQQKRNQRFGKIGAVAAVFLLVSGAGLFAGFQWQIARQKEKIADQEKEIAIRLATEANIKADALLLKNILPVEEPVTALTRAIEITGRSQEQLGEVLPLAQSSLWETLQIARERNQLKGHEFRVYSVAIAPDGSKIVSGSYDNTIQVWDLYSGKPLAVLKGHEGGVRSVAIAPPDGSKIVSGSEDNTIRVWDLYSGKPLAVLKGHEGGVRSVAIAPDGSKIVSGSEDNTIRVWDLHSGKQLAVFKGHLNHVTSVAIAPDGSKIVSGSYDKTIRVWDLHSGKPLAVLKGHEGGVRSVAIAPDGSKIVSGSWDQTIRVWDLYSGSQLSVLKGHESDVNSVAIGSMGIVSLTAPDRLKIVSGSRDKTIRVWDLHSGSQLAVLKGHEDAVRSVTTTPDGSKIVSGSYDHTIRVWDLQSGSELAVLKGHESGIRSVATTPDGSKIVSGSYDHTIRVWDLQSGSELAEFNVESKVNSVAITPDGSKIVSGLEDNRIRVWDLDSGSQLAEFNLESEVNSVAIAPDGSKIVSGLEDNLIRVWDLDSGSQLAEFNVESKVNSVAITPDGSKIVSGLEDNRIRVWDLDSGSQLAVFKGHENHVYSVAITPDGSKIVSGSRDKTIRVWDLQSGSQLAQFNLESGVGSVAIAPDGDKIVSGSHDNTIRLWRGSWQSWLEAGCNRLRSHPVFVEAEEKHDRIALKAVRTCEKLVWVTGY